MAAAELTRMMKKKKLSSFDSFSTLTPPIISPTSADEHNQGNNPIFTREFEKMVDEELSPVFEKKRRLSINQVEELEKNFEVDNRLDPERKVKLALDVGLHPRQVAIWFQNRRARWKTKQLETDYVVLKSNYDSLKHKLEKLHLENQAFLKEIEELKCKLKEDGERTKNQEMTKPVTEEKMNLNTIPVKFIGASYDSDSSGIMNNDDSNTAVSGFFAPPSYYFQKGDDDEQQEEESYSSLFYVDQAPTLQW